MNLEITDSNMPPSVSSMIRPGDTVVTLLFPLSVLCKCFLNKVESFCLLFAIQLYFANKKIM